MIAEDKPHMGDQWLKAPGQIHHIAFILGVVMLGSAKIAVLSAK